MRLTIITTAFAMSVLPAAAAERHLSLDSNQLFAMEQAIGAMSGATVLDANKKAVLIPYDFGPEATLDLADDVRIIEAEIGDFRSVVKKKATGDKTKDAQLANKLAAVKRDVTLEVFPSSELKLGENHILPVLLSAIWPLLSDKNDPIVEAAPKTQ